VKKERERINNLTQKVYENIRRMILEKKISPGSKINQSELSAQLKVSRTPIVKALHILEMQGLVDSVPEKGFYVHSLSIKELLDLFIIREAIDALLAFELTKTINNEQIKQLENILKKFEEALSKGDELSYWRLDQEFHNLMLSFSNNDLAKKINEHFQIFNRAFIGGLIRKPEETLPEHKKIVSTLKMRDGEEARKAVVEHISKSKAFLQEIVNKLQKLGIDPASITINEISRKGL